MYEFIQCYIEYYIGIQRILYLPYTRLGGWGHPMILLMKTSWCTANQERNSIFTNSVWITWKETKLLSGPLERKPSWNQPGPQPPHGFKPCCVLVPLDLIHCQCHLKACTTVTILIQVGDLKVALLYSHHQTIVHLMIHILCISWSTYCASHDPHCQGQSVGSIVLVQHHMRLNASWKSSAVPFWLKFWSHIVRSNSRWSCMQSLIKGGAAPFVWDPWFLGRGRIKLLLMGEILQIHLLTVKRPVTLYPPQAEGQAAQPLLGSSCQLRC